MLQKQHLLQLQMKSWFAFHAFTQRHSKILHYDLALLSSMPHGFGSAGIFAIKVCLQIFPSFHQKLQSAFYSQAENSWLTARLSSRKGGLGAMWFALRSGITPETTCKMILPLGMLWEPLQTCHSAHILFCGLRQKNTLQNCSHTCTVDFGQPQAFCRISFSGIRAGVCQSI